MADTSYFDPTAREPKDLLKTEVRDRAKLLEDQLNLDRVITLAKEITVDNLVPNASAETAAQAVTTATAFDLFTIPVPDEAGVIVEVRCTGFVDDGTDHQAISLLFHVCAINKGGTVTAVVTEGIADVVAASSGTLTLAGAAAEGVADILDVSVTLTTSLTPTTIEIDWQVNVLRGGAVTKVNADA